jgi:hypothetical protein
MPCQEGSDRLGVAVRTVLVAMRVHSSVQSMHLPAVRVPTQALELLKWLRHKVQLGSGCL